MGRKANATCVARLIASLLLSNFAGASSLETPPMVADGCGPLLELQEVKPLSAESRLPIYLFLRGSGPSSYQILNGIRTRGTSTGRFLRVVENLSTYAWNLNLEDWAGRASEKLRFDIEREYSRKGRDQYSMMIDGYFTPSLGEEGPSLQTFRDRARAIPGFRLEGSRGNFHQTLRFYNRERNLFLTWSVNELGVVCVGVIQIKAVEKLSEVTEALAIDAVKIFNILFPERMISPQIEKLMVDVANVSSLKPVK